MHPIKHAASKEQLLPRGGGSFIAEVDGNLTLWADGGVAELHWTGKIRGPDFEPIPFVLESGSCPALVDAKGRELPSVWAYPADRSTVEWVAERQETDQDNVMMALKLNPGASVAQLCEYLGWKGATGQPQKSHAHNVLKRLETERLVEKALGHWALTTKGSRALGRERQGGAPHPAAGAARQASGSLKMPFKRLVE